jgi:hypothetical protein
MEDVDSAKEQLVTVKSTGVSMDTSDQQTFPRIPIRYISGSSDKNRVNPVWRRVPIPPP